MISVIRSMTGFGRAQDTVGNFSILVEVKSVNHRFFEFSCRVPRAYGFLEEKLRTFVQQRVGRGKVDMFVQIEALSTEGSRVAVNYELATGYVQALRELTDHYGIREDLSAVSLSRYPDILAVCQAAVDETAVFAAVQPVAEQALAKFIAMREREGARLRDDVLARSRTIREAVGRVEERSPQTVRERKEKMEARIRELLDGVPLDESRLLTEVAVYADKVAVDEETVRLRSHLEQLDSLVNGDGAVGRKLDFLVQEINREANTIGSKCSDLELTRIVLDVKAEIEKIREQIQNIE